MTADLRPLLDAAGARWGERFGVPVPLRFGERPQPEVAALRTGCGVVVPPLRGLLRLVGEDRTSFLQGMISNDIAACAPGRGCHAAVLTVQGRVVSDLHAYVLEDEIWLDVPVQRTATVRETLEKYIVADDVEIETPKSLALLMLEGPTAPATLSSVVDVDVVSLPPYGHASCSIGGVDGRLFRASLTGEWGCMIVGPPELQRIAWETACAAGGVPVGYDAVEVARIEAGIPMMDVDMDESYLAPEVGLADALSFRKGCYIGQEVVERVAARGNVQRKLVGLVLEGDETVPPGALVRSDERDLGHVTSAAFSEELNAPIALAYVRRSHADAGARVVVDAGAGPRTATVRSLSRDPES